MLIGVRINEGTLRNQQIPQAVDRILAGFVFAALGCIFLQGVDEILAAFADVNLRRVEG